MALSKEYKPGAEMEKIKDTKSYTQKGELRKSNAGRKAMNANLKKKRYTVVMTEDEHNRLIELATKNNMEISPFIVSLINREYKKK